VASNVASFKVSGLIFCVVNKKKMQKVFLSLRGVISLEEYVCCPACNKCAARLRCANSKRISMESIFVPLREILRSLPLLEVEHTD
jgi:hypothetical protein